MAVGLVMDVTIHSVSSLSFDTDILLEWQMGNDQVLPLPKSQ